MAYSNDIVFIESGVSGCWTIAHSIIPFSGYAEWFELGERAYGYWIDLGRDEEERWIAEEL